MKLPAAPHQGDALDALEDSMLRSLLKYGEQLIWVGRPDGNAFPMAGCGAMIFGVPFLILHGCGFGWLLISEREWSRNFLVGCLVWLALCLFGLALTLVPWFYKRSLRKTIYAITDRRVILVRPPARKGVNFAPYLRTEIYAFDASQIRRRAIKWHTATRADILIAHSGATGFTPFQTGFIGLPNWEEAERILEELYPRESPKLLKEGLAGSGPPLSLPEWIVAGGGAILIALIVFAVFRESQPPYHFLFLPALLLGLGYHRLWYVPRRTILSFTCDGRTLAYETASIAGTVPVTNAYVFVRRREGRKTGSRRLLGWWIRTAPGSWIYLRSDTVNSRKLAELLLSFPRWFQPNELKDQFRLHENARVYARNWQIAERNARELLGKKR